jgi:hypothetical protein
MELEQFIHQQYLNLHQKTVAVALVLHESDADKLFAAEKVRKRIEVRLIVVW